MGPLWPISCMDLVAGRYQYYLELIPNEQSFFFYCLCPVPYVNSSHPNISLHILHTVLYTFPKVLTRRIKLASFAGDCFLDSHDRND